MKDKDDPQKADSNTIINKNMSEGSKSNDQGLEKGLGSITDSMVGKDHMQDNIDNQDGNLEKTIEDDDGLLEKNDTDDGDNLDHDIQHVNKIGNLSPRHTNSLNARKGKPKLSLQVTIRSSKGRTSICDQ